MIVHSQTLIVVSGALKEIGVEMKKEGEKMCEKLKKKKRKVAAPPLGTPAMAWILEKLFGCTVRHVAPEPGVQKCFKIRLLRAAGQPLKFGVDS